MAIAVIPVCYDGSIMLDVMDEFDCLITDRTVRRQDPITDLFSAVRLDDLLWDARRQGLNAIETFKPLRPGEQMGAQDAEYIAKMALRSLRLAKARTA